MEVLYEISTPKPSRPISISRSPGHEAARRADSPAKRAFVREQLVLRAAPQTIASHVVVVVSVRCRVTVPGYSALASIAPHPAHMSAWERFGVELILSFLLVLTYCGATDSHRRSLGGAGPAVGAAYLACTLVSVSTL